MLVILSDPERSEGESKDLRLLLLVFLTIQLVRIQRISTEKL